jgi:hypothetical protein
VSLRAYLTVFAFALCSPGLALGQEGDAAAPTEAEGGEPEAPPRAADDGGDPVEDGAVMPTVEVVHPPINAWVFAGLPAGLSLSDEQPATILRLVSGEWVKGELVAVTEGDITLDGDKTAETSYDMADVLELRSTEHLRVTFSDLQYERLEAKRFSLTKDRLILQDMEGIRHDLLRSDLFEVFPVASMDDPLLDRFRGKISLGYTGTFGNSQTLALLGTADLVSQVGDWRLTLGATLTQGRSSGEETSKYRRGIAQLDYDLSARTFLTLTYLEGFYDKFQNIGLRVRAGAGVGLRLLRSQDSSLVLEATAIGTHLKLRSVEDDEDDTELESAMRFGVRFWVEFFDDDLAFDVVAETYMGLHDVNDTTHRVQAQLSWELISDLTMDLTAIYDRNENPQAGSDGVTPKRDDLQLSLGFGWKL